MNRKEFLIAGGRIFILGGMAASAGYLILNNKVDVNCTASSSCTKCSRLSECELPEAEEVKNEQK